MIAPSDLPAIDHAHVIDHARYRVYHAHAIFVDNKIMSITIQEITDAEQWNAFLTSQPRGHLLQSYEWGELNQYLGGRIYRLGALEAIG